MSGVQCHWASPDPNKGLFLLKACLSTCASHSHRRCSWPEGQALCRGQLTLYLSSLGPSESPVLETKTPSLGEEQRSQNRKTRQVRIQVSFLNGCSLRVAFGLNLEHPTPIVLLAVSATASSSSGASGCPSNGLSPRANFEFTQPCGSWWTTSPSSLCEVLQFPRILLSTSC